jgi:hypothetical protein
MNDPKVLRILMSVLFTAILGGTASAATGTDPITGEEYEIMDSVASYAALCDERMEPLREPEVLASIERTNAAIAAHELDAAEAAWTQVYEGSNRGMGSDLPVRCLSEDTLQRYLDTRTGLWRLGSRLHSDGRGGNFTAVYIAGVDGGTAGVVEFVESLPADEFTNAYRSVHHIGQYAAGAQPGGWPRTAQERALGLACEGALKPLRQYADEEHALALTNETDAFIRPATQTDQDMAAQLREANTMMTGMLGVELVEDDYIGMAVGERQTNDSLALLKRARNYEFGLFSQNNPSPTVRRARDRGDQRLTQANNETLGLKLRDSLYSQALGFFKSCGCDARILEAKAAQERIQPALDEVQQQKSEAMERKAEDMMKNVDPEAIRKSVEEMQKSDAEKKSFKDEADALEAELGF